MDPTFLLLKELHHLIPGGVFTLTGAVITLSIGLGYLTKYVFDRAVEFASIWRQTVLDQSKAMTDLFDKVQTMSESHLRHNEAINDRSINAQIEVGKSNALMVEKLNSLLMMVERLCHYSAQYPQPTLKEVSDDKTRKSVARRSVPSSKA